MVIGGCAYDELLPLRFGHQVWLSERAYLRKSILKEESAVLLRLPKADGGHMVRISFGKQDNFINKAPRRPDNLGYCAVSDHVDQFASLAWFCSKLDDMAIHGPSSVGSCMKVIVTGCLPCRR